MRNFVWWNDFNEVVDDFYDVSALKIWWDERKERVIITILWRWHLKINY